MTKRLIQEIQFEQRWEGLKKKHNLTKRFSHGNKGPSSDHRHYFKKALIYSTVSRHEINIFLKA